MNDDDSDNGSSGAALRLAGEAQELQRRTSDAGSAMSAAAKTEVEGRFLMARRFPRSIVVAEQALLEDCKRPGFAATARYARPVGKEKNDSGQWVDKIAAGFSIRFAEAALQRFGNMTAYSHVVAEDEDSVTVRCGCLDYETNAEWHTDVVVPKTQERRELRKGQKPIGTRTNSWGDQVYIVVATAADVQKEIARATSIYCRTAIMRMIPRDVQESCEEAVTATQSAEVKRDPDAALKKLVAAFKNDLSIGAGEIESFVGHSLDGGLQPDEIIDLRAVYMGVKEGHVRWRDLLEERAGAAAEAAKGPSKVDGLRAQLEAKAKERAAKKSTAQAAKAAEAEPRAAEEPAKGPRLAPGEQVDPETGEVVPPPRQPGEDG